MSQERIIAFEWSCEVCGARAGLVSVDQEGHVHRAGFTGTMDLRLDEQAVASLRQALVHQSAEAVFAIDFELATWWCPKCETSYCGDHWNHWAVYDDEDPAWLDSIHGTCPRGHQRKLED